MAAIDIKHPNLLCIYSRWWQNSKCPDVVKSTPSNTQSLAMEKVAGVFVVLAAGIVLSLFACVTEYYYRMCVKRVKNRNRVRHDEVPSTGAGFATSLVGIINGTFCDVTL